MALFVKLGEQLKEDARKCGAPLEKIEQFAAQVESDQSTARFDRFPPPCLTRKKFLAYNNRLIAAEQRIGDHMVVILLRLVVKSSRDYDEFAKDAAAYASRIMAREPDLADLGAWVAQRTHSPLPPPPPEPKGPEDDFLWAQVGAAEDQDILVCETADWLKAIEEERVKSRLVLLPDTIVDILKSKEEGVSVAVAPGDPDLHVIYYFSPRDRRLLLLSAVYAQPKDNLQGLLTQWKKRVTDHDGDTVPRLARRSYPVLICCDNDMWMNVQKDDEANLALSPEEAELLQSVKRTSGEDFGYPLFINGRAGSGKSTILQYLFADCYSVWNKYMRDSAGEESRPLYFACSRDLLAVAKRVVLSLLTANHNMLLAGSSIKTEDAQRTISSSFQEFHSFLYSFVDKADKTSLFAHEKYVDYARFLRLWERQFARKRSARRDYGPQISWHVIRSFIKGLSVDGDIDETDYRDLPRDERTVTQVAFERVHKTVWQAWYEQMCTKGGYWDDQDLVRYVLDKGAPDARHCSVFCDESQDFTRIEIETLYRASLFSKRSMRQEAVSRVPFAFAGDPFQTLNPTGFRWEAIKAAFTERILCSLHRYRERRDIPDLNYRELTFNYRSSRNIVRFCNSVQALRALAFSLTTLQPQLTWQFEEASPMPVFFRDEDPQVQQALREQNDLVIVVPCEPGEEAEYVKKSKVLSEVVQLSIDGTPQNVLSPTRAKGLEFNRVALYGFGQKAEAKDLIEWIEKARDDKAYEDASLPLEYFMNSLYVAASRPRRRLFVVDSSEALKSFWAFVADNEQQDSVLQRLPNQGKAWSENLGQIIQGVPDHWCDDRDDPKSLAESYEADGKSKEDAYLLRQAATQYRNLRQLPKAHECQARAAYYEQDFSKSGQYFEAAGLWEDALAAYWEGSAYKELVALSTKERTLANTPKARVAAYIVESQSSVKTATLLLDHIRQAFARDESPEKEIITAAWQKALNRVLRKCTHDQLAQPETDAWKKLHRKLASFAQLGMVWDRLQLAKVSYNAEDYAGTMNLLEADRGSDLYRDARAQNVISSASQSTSGPPVEECRAAAEFLLRANRFLEAADWFGKANAPNRVEECLVAIVKEGAPEKAVCKVVETWILALVAKGDWNRVVGVMREVRIKNLKQADVRRVAKVIKQEKLYLRLVVPALARASVLDQEPSHVQDLVWKHLKGQLCGDAVAWGRWRSTIPLEIAGAAVERRAKDIDALAFYERLEADKQLTEQEAEFAKKRWIKCKLRQAKRVRHIADADDKNARLGSMAKDYEEEAGRSLRLNGWTSEDLGPEYPRIKAVGEELFGGGAVAKPAQTEASDVQGEMRWTLGALEFRYFPDKRRVRIESTEGDIALVDLMNRTVSSDHQEFQGDRKSSYWCEQWQLGLRFPMDKPGVAVFQVANEVHDLTFDV